jgi:cellulose synthase/poly-beta-1,6-N-acetylglucosamine synthase-like glycosyltransferase
VKSDYPKDRLEIIAIDDCSTDDSFEFLLAAKRDFSDVNILASQNDRNRGKAHTVFSALHQSNSEVIISIDSDCIFEPNAIKEVVSCLADPKIGAVGSVIGVRNTNDNVLTNVQTLVYYAAFHLMKGLETCTRSVTCIAGCMFAVRREVMLSMEERVRSRNFLGIRVNEGEDRFLTHQILLAGYGTVVNTDAQCWTTVPHDLHTLFKQQLRWQRGSTRDFLLTLKHLPHHVCRLHLNAVYMQLFPVLTLVLSVCVTVLAMAHGIPPLLGPLTVSFVVATMAVLHLAIRKWSPEQKVVNPLFSAAFVGWFIVRRLIEVVALLTLDSTDWETRTALSHKPPPATQRTDTEPKSLFPQPLAVGRQFVQRDV